MLQFLLSEIVDKILSKIDFGVNSFILCKATSLVVLVLWKIFLHNEGCQCWPLPLWSLVHSSSQNDGRTVKKECWSLSDMVKDYNYNNYELLRLIKFILEIVSDWKISGLPHHTWYEDSERRQKQFNYAKLSLFGVLSVFMKLSSQEINSYVFVRDSYILMSSLELFNYSLGRWFLVPQDKMVFTVTMFDNHKHLMIVSFTSIFLGSLSIGSVKVQ